MKEEEEIRREVGERGAGGVARDRRASAELDRRAFIVGGTVAKDVSASFTVSVWLGGMPVASLAGLLPRE